ncbi:MAG TPA: O-antigen ligase family protein [Methylomirabilota bacterium]|nr:O-antigen ligase family protein [Methylomirabilota bacterium]
MSRKPKAESREPDSKPSTLDRAFALAFGLFLGLTIWKFGNPVILDEKILPPISFSEFLNDPWPTHCANWIFLPLAIIGAFLALKNKSHWRATKWLWLLPLLWFGWQMVSATQTIDATLTAMTLWQFFGCVACYFLGAFLFGTSRALNLLLIGILAAFAFCLVRAVDQRIFEFPQNRQMLMEGERENWINVPPEMFLQMKRDGVIISTNGMDVANPAMLRKFSTGRVMGALVYPNALAGIILLLLPIALTLAFTKKIRPVIRIILIALTCFLGGGALFWSGSKLGWLIAMALGGLCLFRFRWPVKLKVAALALILIFGLGIFAVRFHDYFSSGATSISARLDYWRAAVQTTENNPLLGSGPGTFQHPYAQIKSPDAEMARLAHNDYLEQFSDSGIPGGIFYASWIALVLATIGRRVWKNGDSISFAIFTGLLGWFIQGIGEFSLYIPALAWTAFTLLGCLLVLTTNPFDKKLATG